MARWTATSGVPAEAAATGDPRALHPQVEVTLLRVAQEALANVAKHAAASHAWVTLSYMEDVVSLDVRDDGAWRTPPSRSPNGTSSVSTASHTRHIVSGAPRRGRSARHSDGAGTAKGWRRGRRRDAGQRRVRADRHAPGRVSRMAGELEIESEPGEAPRCRPACPPSRWEKRA